LGAEINETGRVVEEYRNNRGQALFFETDIPAWKGWYERKKDPFSLQLIESAAMLGATMLFI
jgi:hypothetical protein